MFFQSSHPAAAREKIAAQPAIAYVDASADRLAPWPLALARFPAAAMEGSRMERLPRDRDVLAGPAAPGTRAGARQ